MCHANDLRDPRFGGPSLDRKRTAAGDSPLSSDLDWLSDYDFELPPERIAREPVHPRSSSRLFVGGRHQDEVVHDTFAHIGNHLRPNDLLVLNETRVLPARLFAKLERTGRDMEILLSHPTETGTTGAKRRSGGEAANAASRIHAESGAAAETESEDWLAMLGPSRRLRPDDRLCLTETDGAFVVVERAEGPLWRIRSEGRRAAEWMAAAGHQPLPPYLDRSDRSEDSEWYQTVFARKDGAVAAPTAGLHFTKELLADLEAQGVRTARVVLHVGPGTFLPVRAESVEQHRVLRERFEVGQEAAASIGQVRRDGGRVIAVGTTVVRALESWALSLGVGASRGGPENRKIQADRKCREVMAAGHGWADLTITPGYGFRLVDALITNFHLPRSSLLLLVSAFAGRERMLAYYDVAIAEGYRFYSYGDAMFLR